MLVYMPTKPNCWEVMGCGRGPNGVKVAELGLCPVVNEKRLDGIHGGQGAGRACWVVAGSLCGGKVQGTYASKFENCQSCRFYAQVKSEEGGGFVLAGTLLPRLRTSG
jgi:hypothetical protein